MSQLKENFLNDLSKVIEKLEDRIRDLQEEAFKDAIRIFEAYQGDEEMNVSPGNDEGLVENILRKYNVIGESEKLAEFKGNRNPDALESLNDDPEQASLSRFMSKVQQRYEHCDISHTKKDGRYEFSFKVHFDVNPSSLINNLSTMAINHGWFITDVKEQGRNEYTFNLVRGAQEDPPKNEKVVDRLRKIGKQQEKERDSERNRMCEFISKVQQKYYDCDISFTKKDGCYCFKMEIKSEIENEEDFSNLRHSLDTIAGIYDFNVVDFKNLGWNRFTFNLERKSQ